MTFRTLGDEIDSGIKATDSLAERLCRAGYIIKDIKYYDELNELGFNVDEIVNDPPFGIAVAADDREVVGVVFYDKKYN